jgi:hypothetical protein
MAKTQTKQTTAAKIATTKTTATTKPTKKTRTQIQNPQKLLADCRHPRHILVEMVKTRQGYEIVGGIINVGVNQHKFYTVPVSGEIIGNDIMNTTNAVAKRCARKSCKKTEGKK